MSPQAVASALFLAYVLAFLPWAAWRSGRHLDAARRAPRDGPGSEPGYEPGVLPSTEQILASTLFSLAVLLAFAWVTAWISGRELFGFEPPGPRAVAATAVAFGLHLAFLWVSRVVRSEAERRGSHARALMPRTRRQWGLYAAVCALAGVAEEAAYRGVAVWILSPWIGLPAAALVSATAFAVSHALQGWKSAVIVFFMALVMHAFVAVTGTLVLAMLVHAVYDLVAGWVFARQVRRWDAQDAARALARP